MELNIPYSFVSTRTIWKLTSDLVRDKEERGLLGCIYTVYVFFLGM